MEQTILKILQIIWLREIKDHTEVSGCLKYEQTFFGISACLGIL